MRRARAVGEFEVVGGGTVVLFRAELCGGVGSVSSGPLAAAVRSRTATAPGDSIPAAASLSSRFLPSSATTAAPGRAAAR
jgi:hypothetical protein